MNILQGNHSIFNEIDSLNENNKIIYNKEQLSIKKREIEWEMQT